MANLPPARKSKAWSRPLADFVGAAIDPLAAKRGFGESDLLMNWEQIVGPRLAGVCEPIRLQWPPRAPKAPPDAPPNPAALHLRVEGAFALEVQHLAPVLCERVNARLGWKCIDRVVLKQGPLERLERAARPAPRPDAATRARAAAAAEGIEDAGLRDALTRLGAAIMSSSRAKS